MLLVADAALNAKYGNKDAKDARGYIIAAPPTVHEGTLFARARLVRVGSSICVVSVDLTDSERRLVGMALVTYMLLGNRR